ncbi:MAG TPA: DUF4349 domain-containing protein [Gemmatimonadales bacterium]|nr:DUF4349 domain-containing protein [Gemmatimonadales bacterium]
MKTLAIALTAGTLFAFLACGDHQRPARMASHDSASAPHRIGYDARGRPAAVALSQSVVTGTPEWTALAPADANPSMIIRTATASVEVDSLESAIARLKELAARVGGYVANTDIETGNNRQRQGDVEVKVPATRFEEALSGLTPIGRLESVNVEAQDVGEEFVDVTARMENAKRLEQRLIQLLATRTGKLKDVLAVEESLARVREEIERHEGRIRYLQAHTAMSTLSVTVHEPFPVVGTAGKSVMGEAFTQAWRNFVVLLAFVIQSLGVVLPLAVVAIAGWLLTKRMRLARQRTA